MDSITVAGVTVLHNSMKWKKCTNRHPTTSGNAWGWIEHAPGNVTWSNDHVDGFNGAAASQMVTEHNQWLEDMKSPALKLLEARERFQQLHQNCEHLKTAAMEAFAKASAAQKELAELETITATKQTK